MARKHLLFAAVLVGCATARPPVPLHEFHNGFWTNLHDALYNEAHGPDESGHPVIKPLVLTGDDRRIWGEAVQAYRATIGGKEYTRDRELLVALDVVARVDAGADLASVELRPEVLDALRRAAPIYRANSWPEVRRMNEQFIADAKRAVAAHGERVARRLSEIFRDPWPRPARIDVVRYAMWAGAYTRVDLRTGLPKTIMASGEEGNRARLLEIVFHEPSHAIVGPNQGTVMKAINARCRTPRDFWHVLLFYSVGEAVKEELGPSYVPYAEAGGLWKIPSWGKSKSVLEATWKPYIEGRRSFEDGVGDICAQFPPAPVP